MRNKYKFAKKYKDSQTDLILIDSKKQNPPKLTAINNHIINKNISINDGKFNKRMEKITNSILKMEKLKDNQNSSIKNNRIDKFLINEVNSNKEKRKIQIRKGINYHHPINEKNNMGDILKGKNPNIYIINNLKDTIEEKNEDILVGKTGCKIDIKIKDEKKEVGQDNLERNNFINPNQLNLEKNNYNKREKIPSHNPNFLYYPEIYGKNASKDLNIAPKKKDLYSKPKIYSEFLNNSNKFEHKRNLVKTIDNKKKLENKIIYTNKNGFAIDENRRKTSKINLNGFKNKKNLEINKIKNERGNININNNNDIKINCKNGYNLKDLDNNNGKSIRNKYKLQNINKYKDEENKINNEKRKKENLMILDDNLESKTKDNINEIITNKKDISLDEDKTSFSKKELDKGGIKYAINQNEKEKNDCKKENVNNINEIIINNFNEHNQDNQLEIIDSNKIILEKKTDYLEQKNDIYNPFENEDYKAERNILNNNQNLLYDNTYNNNIEIPIDNRLNAKDKNYIKNLNNELKDISPEKQEKYLYKNRITNQCLINEKEIQKADEIEKKENAVKIIKDSYIEEKTKLYGFINRGNNCYLNSSLQLLTRIKDLKDKILDFNEICKDNSTKGEIIIQFKKILKIIENDYEPRINPDNLKKTMSNIDERYLYNNQEDANEFISNFLDGLLEETANKQKAVEKIQIDNDKDKQAYERLYKRYFNKIGYSFLYELFYGILKTQKTCEKCKEINSIKFNSYNMLDLSIYDLAKKNIYKTLYLEDILNQYISEYKNKDVECKYCEKTNCIITKITVYTLPKYLILFFERNYKDEYLSNNIIYPLEFDFNTFFSIKEKKNNSHYILDCVIEHSGGANFGHYTTLCPIDKKNQIWYRFSDSNWNKYNVDYQSENAIILLYKLI